MKIAVYAISKNEEAFIERFMASCKDADYVIIGDTGSTDGTAELARSLGASVYDVAIVPWRFDVARNAVLSLVPRDCDICISLDLDEVLEKGWRAEIERCWKADTTRMRYTFDWSNGVIFKSEKIHARNGYLWKYACHERIVPDPRTTEVWVESDALLIRHLPDSSKSRASYLELLEVAAKEDPNDPRTALYYARELSFAGKDIESFKEFKRYLSLPNLWAAEKAYAERLIGRFYHKLEELDLAEKWYTTSAFTYPEMRDAWCELARLHYETRNWEESLKAAQRALQIETRTYLYMEGPEFFGAFPHDYLAIAASNLKMSEIAEEHARKALELSPEDERLKRNLDAIVASRST